MQTFASFCKDIVLPMSLYKKRILLKGAQQLKQKQVVRFSYHTDTFFQLQDNKFYHSCQAGQQKSHPFRGGFQKGIWCILFSFKLGFAFA
jgi:hypothetical protein